MKRWYPSPPLTSRNVRPRHNSTITADQLRTFARSIPALRAPLGGNTSFSAQQQNDDTRINLNNDHNTVALFNRKRKRPKTLKAKKGQQKKRAFKKKVRKAITSFQKWQNYHITFTNVLTPTVQSITQASQMLFPTYTAGQFTYGIGYGALYTTTKDHAYIATQLAGIGHVEDGVAINDSAYNLANISYYIKGHANLTIEGYTSTAAISAAQPLWFDVYELVAARNIGDNQIAYVNPMKAWVNCLTECSTPTESVGVPQQATPFDRGQIPSNCPGFSKYWKILKVTRFFTESEHKQFQYDLTTSGMISHRTSLQNYCLKGITKTIMIVAQPIGKPWTGSPTFTFDIQTDKNFKFKLKDGKDPVNAKPQMEWNFTRTTTV